VEILGFRKYAAILLALEGHKVIIGCKNQYKGEQALAETKCRCPWANVELTIVDMSSQTSIRSLTQNLYHCIENWIF